MASELPAATREGIAEPETARSEHRDKGNPPSPSSPLLFLEGEPARLLAEARRQQCPGDYPCASFRAPASRRDARSATTAGPEAQLARRTADAAGRQLACRTPVAFAGHDAERVAGRLTSRLLSNLTGSARSSCEWISAGRRIPHSAEPGALYLSPGVGLSSVTGHRRSNFDNQPSHDADESRVWRPRRARELALGLPNGPIYWAEISDTLASGVARYRASRAGALRTSVLPNASIRKTNDVIAEAMGQQIALEVLAQAAGYSRFHFLRIFTKTLGMTPSRYVMHRRVWAAVSMAKDTRDSLTSIAYATGFADQSHLSRWCRKVYGVRLSEVRPH
jgi:AraC-like DNA-binding protein